MILTWILCLVCIAPAVQADFRINKIENVSSSNSSIFSFNGIWYAENRFNISIQFKLPVKKAFVSAEILIEWEWDSFLLLTISDPSGNIKKGWNQVWKSHESTSDRMVQLIERLKTLQRNGTLGCWHFERICTWIGQTLSAFGKIWFHKQLQCHKDFNFSSLARREVLFWFHNQRRSV